MNTQKIREFFDSLAESWDQGMVINEEIINTILDDAGIRKDREVLDVACGTGVLIPFYLQRGVSRVTAIDISEQMCRIAVAKFANNDKVAVVCADILNYQPAQQFDAIVIYNALPHFPDDQQLIKVLHGLLRKDGLLTIAHGMSRERINSHHRNVSPEIKKSLKPAKQLAEIMSAYLNIETIIDSETMYQVTGRKLTD